MDDTGSSEEPGDFSWWHLLAGSCELWIQLEISCISEVKMFCFKDLSEEPFIQSLVTAEDSIAAVT
jgi:hypothetical protein